VSVDSVVSGGSLLLAAPVAAAAGLLSFLSPCVLPLVPGYLSYVTGLTGAELAGTAPPAARRDGEPGAGKHDRGGVTTLAPLELAPAAVRSRVVAGAVLFVAGFSAVFITTGALFGQLGSALAVHRRALEQVLGIVTVVVGLAFAGLLTRVPAARWLGGTELRLHRRPGAGLAAAPVLGVLFGLGWSPCLGPTLTAVAGLSAQSSTAGRGALLGLAYCLGLGVPFLAVAVGFRRAAGALAALRAHAGTVTLVGGALLVAVGLAEVTGLWGEWVRSLQLGGTQGLL